MRCASASALASAFSVSAFASATLRRSASSACSFANSRSASSRLFASSRSFRSCSSVVAARLRSNIAASACLSSCSRKFASSAFLISGVGFSASTSTRSTPIPSPASRLSSAIPRMITCASSSDLFSAASNVERTSASRHAVCAIARRRSTICFIGSPVCAPLARLIEKS